MTRQKPPLSPCYILPLLLIALAGVSPFASAQTGTAALSKTQKRFLEEMARQEARQTQIVEERLAKWKPTNDNDATPSPGQPCNVQDISGLWRSPGGLDVAQFKLFSMGGDTYRVLFYTGGCLSRWSLNRTATYTNGVLLLDRPVEEYGSRPYRRLFTIRTPGGVRMISDAALRWSRRQHEKTPDSLWMLKNETRVVKPMPRLAPEKKTAAKKPPIVI